MVQRSKKRVLAFLGGHTVLVLVVVGQLMGSPAVWNSGIITADQEHENDEWMRNHPTSQHSYYYSTTMSTTTHDTDTIHLPSLIACNNSYPSSPMESRRRRHPPPHLQFVHIRKTGGTAIELALRLVGHRRGNRNNNNYYWKNGNAIDLLATKKLNRTIGNRKHLPPRYFQRWSHRRTTTSTTATDVHSLFPLRLFAVVRNPYDRAVSEYYQHFKNRELTNNTTPNSRMGFSLNDPSILNDFLQTNLRNPDKDLFIPQHEYIFDANGNRIVDHILHFEELHKEFRQLMECYGIFNARLPIMNVNKRQPDAVLTSLNLTRRSIRLINQVEEKSFVEFGYSMRDED